MGDTGLLVSHAFGENKLAAKDIHNRLLMGDIELNEGMVVENAVATSATLPCGRAGVPSPAARGQKRSEWLPVRVSDRTSVVSFLK